MAHRDFSLEFGRKVRKLRGARDISLRKFAAMVDMSPTYLSKVERGEFPPPAEKKVVAIAKALNQNPDELLALAGRVASDLDEIIQKQPTEMAEFLRAATGLSSNRLQLFAEKAQELKQELIVGATPKAMQEAVRDDLMEFKERLQLVAEKAQELKQAIIVGATPKAMQEAVRDDLMEFKDLTKW